MVDRGVSYENVYQWVFNYGGDDGEFETLIRLRYSNPLGYCSYKIADMRVWQCAENM